MADEKRQPGRPRVYHEPRQRLTLELPHALIAAIDKRAIAAGQTRTTWIESAIRERLERGE